MDTDQSVDGTEQSQCTDKLCEDVAKYALWMGDKFSRVTDAHESMPYDDGDLHPHVCETCLPRYEDRHGDLGEFVDPREKLVADGGSPRSDSVPERPPCDEIQMLYETAPYPELERRVCPNCRLYFDVGEESEQVFCSKACERRHQRGELL
jgi:hypothetical protein